MPFLPLYLYLYVLICMAEKKIKKYVWEANMRCRRRFLGGVHPPFKRLNNNFLPVLGHFWASSVFLFTCMAVSPLHYMYNVIESNGCFPLFIRVSGVFAIFPFIVPFPFPFPPLLFPSLPFLSLPFPFFGVFWVGFLKEQSEQTNKDARKWMNKEAKGKRTKE